MGNDIEKGTTYATGGVGGQGTITSSNLNAHVDDAMIKSTFVTAKAERTPGGLTDQILLESGGTLYRMLLSTLQPLLITHASAPVGSVIQTMAATPYVANADITTVIPADDTIPQITEGTQILTLNITPHSAINQIRLDFSGQFTMSVATNGIVALFRNPTANSIAARTQWSNGVGVPHAWSFSYIDSPASTSTQTYSLRVGPGAAGTLRMNGTNTARLLGGVSSATLMAQEIKV